MAARVLINGSPIATSFRRAGAAAARQATAFDDRPEGIARIDGMSRSRRSLGTHVVECGAIRERVSQELAREVFDAVKKDLETQC